MNTKSVKSLDTPSGRLAAARVEKFGLRGKAAMARALGLKAGTYESYERGLCNVPYEVLLRVSLLTGRKLRWLALGEGPEGTPENAAHPEAVRRWIDAEIAAVEGPVRVAEKAERYRRLPLRVPVLAVANAAGTGCRIARDPDSAEEKSVTIPAGAHMVKVHDDSMKPVALPGQYVWVAEEEPKEKDLALIRMPDDEVIFKRVHFQGDQVMLISVNQDAEFAPRLIKRRTVTMRRVLGVWWGTH